MRGMAILGLAVATLMAGADRAAAQLIGGGGGGGLGGGGGGLGGGGGGVYLDAEGVVRVAKKSKKSAKGVAPDLRAELARRSELRQVSLKQLDRKLREALAKDPSGKSLPEDLLRLAGLFRIDSIVIDRSAQDVLLCGPAEGWIVEPDGRAVGKTSHRPALELGDLATAMRCVFNGPGEVRCSIDPRKEGLAAAVNYEVPTPTGERSQAEATRKEVEKRLGFQVVTTGGVPAGSRFALAMIDADYRMKRMAMGMEKVAGLFSHLDAVAELNDGSPSFRTPLARWWFTAAYDGVVSDAEQTVFRFEGQGIKLLNEEVFVDQSGNRQGSGRSSAQWDKFSQAFTKMLPKLEEKFTCFADLHNLYDLMMAVALVRQQGAADWFKGSALLDESLFPIPSFPTPKFTEPVVAFKQAKRTVDGRSLNLLNIAFGGVSMRPGDVLGDAKMARVDPGVAKAAVPASLTKSSGVSGGNVSGAAKSDEPAAAKPLIPSPAPSVAGNEVKSDSIPTGAGVVGGGQWWVDVRK